MVVTCYYTVGNSSIRKLHCTQLNISNNKIGDDGAKALATNLHHCTQLNILDLSNNKIGDDGAIELAVNVHHCTQLGRFDIS